MAVVTTQLVATLSRTVFVKPPDVVRQFTAIPRAIVNFNILNGVIDAKPVNDSQELLVSFTLDPTFAYKLVDLSMSLVQDVANDWNVRGYLELTNAVRNLELGATERHAVILDDAIQTPGQSEMWIARMAAVHNLPRYVIQAPPGGGGAEPVTVFRAVNQNAAVGAAGTMNFFLTFFEYEIEQAEFYALHYPVQVYER